MDDRSVYDYAFLGEVSYWFETSDELFVAVRYAHAGGDRDYLFADSFAQILDLANILPPTTDIVVFRQKQLPYRGTADESLLSAALAGIPDGADWLLLTRRREGEQDFTSKSGSTHEGLRGAFGEFRGKYVAVGAAPVFSGADGEDVQSALVPFPDGSVQRAEAY
ncbi:MAG TPA: hypothetical protein VFG99_04540 [Chloroflexia bacterium]|nr:hypothetical protein [Chloroflexia bacterium]HET6314598.1 hypothetical protein [Chloroflexia bacterium]